MKKPPGNKSAFFDTFASKHKLSATSLKTPIYEIGLTDEAQTQLEQKNIYQIGDLVLRTEKDLSFLKEDQLDLIKAALETRILTFGIGSAQEIATAATYNKPAKAPVSKQRAAATKAAQLGDDVDAAITEVFTQYYPDITGTLVQQLQQAKRTYLLQVHTLLKKVR